MVGKNNWIIMSFSKLFKCLITDNLTYILVEQYSRNSIREKTCPIFDSLWRKETVEYKIPSKSFCSDYCPLFPKPYWFQCDRGIMPEIKYFYGKERSCSVNSGNGVKDAMNEKCMNMIATFFTKSDKDQNTIVYITSGFGFGNYDWLPDLKDSIFNKYGEGNIIVGIIYWDSGSKGVKSGSLRNTHKPFHENTKWAICCIPSVSFIPNYGVASVNTWPIGNIVAYINEKISKTSSGSTFRTVCIGNSLGAHLCGFFGKMSQQLDPSLRIDKIIGLDPASPIWEYDDQNPRLRLNKDDAKEVEIFHTNSNKIGFQNPIGSIDFYINGGSSQPGCTFNNDILEIVGSCSHLMAKTFLIHLNNNNNSCFASWKCNITDGSKLAHIEDEDVSSLNSNNCFPDQKITVGDLVSLKGINKGVYWVDMDKESKTCYFDGY